LDVDIAFRLAAVIALLASSAFFSSVESAYFSLSRLTLERLETSTDPRARRVVRLLKQPRWLLSSMLTANIAVNTAAAAIATLLVVHMTNGWRLSQTVAVILEVFGVTLMILLFSELAPKMLALRNSEKWALKSSWAVMLTRAITAPVSYPLTKMTVELLELFGVEWSSITVITEQEIRALIHAGQKHGALEVEESKMIHSIFELGDTVVRKIMVPRIDIVATDKDASLLEIVGIIKTCGHSRIPVFDEQIDNIIGIVHAKDLLGVVAEPKTFDLQRIMHKPYFIPEEKKTDDLLHEFQSEKIHMAIVVDEYGGTAGLVTFEDIIEEIVGEIQDEYDREQPLITRLDDKTITASGRLGISDLNEALGSQLIEEGDAFDTLTGFVYSQLEAVPRKGDKFEFLGYTFIVEELQGKRISRVRIEKMETAEQDV
jgi:putative hemolysin